MDQLTTDLDQLRLASLAWGPVHDPTAPLAVLLHGFPDTAHTWRHLGAALAGAGYRVVAPFTRGYGPSGFPADGSYHVPALMSDALELHAALGGDERAVLVGHDWGAITANGIGAYDASPFRRVVSLAVPPFEAMNPRPGDIGRWARILPRQALLSWYTVYNQLPGLPERRFDDYVARLWSRWSPGYDAADDLAHLASSLPTSEHRSAVLGYYRAAVRPWQVPSRYRHLGRAAIGMPRVPFLFLHGADDGCLDPRWAAQVSGRLDGVRGSRVAVVADAGHFLQLERPAVVNALIVEFLAELDGTDGTEEAG
ncbi:alpha/beta hydrolase [Nocardioides silvaticus]|uniref:Alpha/beta hydrolase n=1 Tax=Nocardioides silvaticus TaxID=2201891 RepID=A0A316TC84_9ACTN|nr:alpha/beta fold hydrolase [Nocardioides silvaticus]PWN01368.1 alpha/beta hydrolase [Nocardioides silvaticus]